MELFGLGLLVIVGATTKVGTTSNTPNDVLLFFIRLPAAANAEGEAPNFCLCICSHLTLKLASNLVILGEGDNFPEREQNQEALMLTSMVTIAEGAAKSCAEFGQKELLTPTIIGYNA
jgi:hypothetical protein